MKRIDIPGFDAFLSDMGEDRIVEWTDIANESVRHQVPVRPPLTNESASEFATAVCSLSQRIAVEMLRDYHEWLIEKLSQKSVHLL